MMIQVKVKPSHAIYLDLVSSINSKIKKLDSVEEVFKDVDINGDLNNVDSCIYRTVLKMFDIAVMDSVVSLDQIYVDIEYLTGPSENFELPYAVSGWFVSSGFIGSCYARGNEDNPEKFYTRIYATGTPKPVIPEIEADTSWYNGIMTKYNSANVYNSGEYSVYNTRFVEANEVARKLIPIVKEQFSKCANSNEFNGIPTSLSKLYANIETSDLDGYSLKIWNELATEIVKDFLVKSGFTDAGGKYESTSPWSGKWVFNANFKDLN